VPLLGADARRHEHRGRDDGDEDHDRRDREEGKDGFAQYI